MIIKNQNEIQTFIDLMSEKNDVNVVSFQDIKNPYHINYEIDFYDLDLGNICENKDLVKSLENSNLPILNFGDELLKAMYKYDVDIEKLKLTECAKSSLFQTEVLTPKEKYHFFKKIKSFDDFSYIVSSIYMNEEDGSNEVFDLSMVELSDTKFQNFARWETTFCFSMSENLKTFYELFENISEERLEKIFNIWDSFFSIFTVYQLTAYYKAIHYLENPHLLPKQLQPDFLKSAAMNQEFSFLKEEFNKESEHKMGFFLEKIETDFDEKKQEQYKKIYYAFEMQYAIDNCF